MTLDLAMAHPPAPVLERSSLTAVAPAHRPRPSDRPDYRHPEAPEAHDRRHHPEVRQVPYRPQNTHDPSLGPHGVDRNPRRGVRP